MGKSEKIRKEGKKKEVGGRRGGKICSSGPRNDRRFVVSKVAWRGVYCSG